MIELKAASVIDQLVDKFLDRKVSSTYNESFTETTAPGLVFQLHASIGSHTNGESFTVYRTVWLAFTRHTSVFVAVQPRDEHWYGAKDIPVDAWKNTSNHDSCWRSDGIDSPLTSVYFEMCEEVNDLRVAAGLDSIAPNSMHQFSHLSSSVFQEVMKTTVTDYERDTSGYHRKLVDIVAKV